MLSLHPNAREADPSLSVGAANEEVHREPAPDVERVSALQLLELVYQLSKLSPGLRRYIDRRGKGRGRG